MPPARNTTRSRKAGGVLSAYKNMSDKKFYIIITVLLAAILTAAYFSFISPPGSRKRLAASAMPEIAVSYIADKKIIIADGEGRKFEYKIKGVCYGPDIEGKTFYENYGNDLILLKQCGAGSVRTYRPLAAYSEDGSLDKEKTKELLDMSLREGITVAAGFSYDDMAENGLLEEYLSLFGNHPALLMIVLGNEYNYHYGEWFSKEEWLGRLADAVLAAKSLAPGRIIATVHGEMPSEEEYAQYVNAGVDLVMMNIYRGANFGFAKENWHDISDKMPWVLGEFGRSSKDAQGNDTSKLQVSMLQTLIRSMEQGYLFMLTDDPEKGETEISPNIGREDSLGIYDKYRTPKKAVSTVKAEYDKIVNLRPL